MIQPAKRLGLVQEYYFSTKLKEIAQLNSEGKSIVNLGIGSPDLPPSPPTIETLVKYSQQPQNHAYQSYVGLPALREGLATWYKQWYGVTLNPVNEILPLIGSKEGIMHIAMAYLEADDEVLVPNPGYPTYRAASLLAGATLREYNLSQENAWLPNLAELESQDLSRIKLMWVNYPNMPTGAMATPRFFEQLVAFAQKYNILLVNDNPYSFILNDLPISLLAAEGASNTVLELNSLSKSHNMAGWRVGMVAGNKDLIANVLKFKSNMDSGMFLPMQMAAIEALKNTKQWYNDLNQVYKQRQKKVFELLDLLHCSYNHSQTGMFVWAKVPNSFADGYALSDECLYNACVFLTPGGIFGSQGNGYIRVSLCADIRVLEEAIARIKLCWHTDL